MQKLVSKDTPLAEITLRRYETPSNIKERELIKKLCLSIGLLQPGDSRDIIVDVLLVLLYAKKEKKELSSEEIQGMVIDLRKKDNMQLKGIAGSNIRRQLKRLKDLFLVENIKNNYRITEFDDIDVIFEKRIEKFYINSILERVREYFKVVSGK
ncbi:hypothetical protein HYX19_02970 [Candidatus Woesearchaeota archaeon]|nr:hypothetical protein [Candidatus Woesearchaeota archaeon]